mmetsp:Transcript_34760/g.52355  ORF Transcript_34760/g.52355 Transcript_34760/m.52355 type:complete len:285 (+) Transcript_34760:71-925(+)|eukprot:CAMPEP_0194754668 /NCGR_PEP_ID=MMETSP0323_2-20130528/8607_1 /TAXON_ID=2866 ORGANISM="Crypthecodinium cohnii, Strain Seligo" /NCGR_SAMPLE_ID=MMETSP0323_2 /ASSEMBLY_ACC=CAM_ASM_000346 /LENGTH=284 /DNA_ID=CAMNT_0039673323 /DNA_START=14 /DNA_END=868 /DNA_ORIENTATION=+
MTGTVGANIEPGLAASTFEGEQAPPERTEAEFVPEKDDLDDLKDAAIQDITSVTRARKKPKLSHGLFFDNEKGFRELVKTFPKICFRGKGREFDDLNTLLQNYQKWFKELYPYGENFEDLTLKTRNILQEKERDPDGVVSDPKEKLHLFRFAYKHPKEHDEELERELRSMARSTTVDSEAKHRTDEFRTTESSAGGTKTPAPAKGTAAGATQEDDFMDEDVFGFGAFGMDDTGPSQAGKATATTPAANSASRLEDEEMFGGGPTAFDEPPDEDVFGFGGGFDDF